MMDRDDLVDRFEALTTPETPAAPAFQQSGRHNTLINVQGNHGPIVLGAPLQPTAQGAARALDRFAAVFLPVTAIGCIGEALALYLDGMPLMQLPLHWRLVLVLPAVVGVGAGIAVAGCAEIIRRLRRL